MANKNVYFVILEHGGKVPLKQYCDDLYFDHGGIRQYMAGKKLKEISEADAKKYFFTANNKYRILLENGDNISLRDYCLEYYPMYYELILASLREAQIFEISPANLATMYNNIYYPQRYKTFKMVLLTGEKIPLIKHFVDERLRPKYEFLKNYMLDNNLFEMNDIIITSDGKSISLFHLPLDEKKLTTIYSTLSELGVREIEYQNLVDLLKQQKRIKRTRVRS